MIDTRIGDLNALAEKQSEVNSLFTLLVTYKKVKCLILRNLTGKAYFTRSNRKDMILQFNGHWCKWRMIDVRNDSAVNVTAREIHATSNTPDVIPEISIQTTARPI